MLWNTFDEDFSRLDRYHNPRFEPGTGIDTNERLQEEIKRIDDEMAGQPHYRVKGEILTFALDHAAVMVNPCDWFGVNIVGWVPDRASFPYRMFDSISYTRWLHEGLFEKDEQGRKISGMRELYGKTGCSWSYPDMSHFKPNWDDILALGAPGLLARAQHYRDEKIAAGVYDRKAADFYEPVIQVCQAFVRLLGRFADCADKHRNDNEKMPLLRDALRSLAERPPETLYEVLLLTFIYTLIQEYIAGIQTRTLGNADKLWRPYYDRDLAAGRLTREQAVELMQYFYMQYALQGHPHAQPIHVAGSDRDGSSLVSDFSYVLLEAYENLNIVSPKIQVAVAKNTPDEYLKKLCRMLRDGHTSIAFCNEDMARKSLRRLTDDEDDIADPALSGCYNFSLKQDAQPEPVGLNFAKPVELALHNGVDPSTGLKPGIETGRAEDFTDFEQFFEAYMAQLFHLIDEAVVMLNFYDAHQRELNPGLLLSANFESSLREGKDFLHNGSKYHHSVVTVSCMASAVDSLYAVKKYVFERKMVTLPELRDILAADWEGHEHLRQIIAGDREKYGNNLDAVDSIAVELMHRTAQHIMEKRNIFGQTLAPDGEGINHGITFGKKTGATPDGRRAGDQLSKNLQSVFGCDTSGVTAYLQSVTKIDASEYPNGAPIDFALHPTAVSGEEGINVLLALIRTTFAHGGAAVQGNIYDVKTLKAAQAEPEKYKGLQVRLCGWSQYFHRLSRAEQDMLIRQAETV